MSEPGTRSSMWSSGWSSVSPLGGSGDTEPLIARPSSLSHSAFALAITQLLKDWLPSLTAAATRSVTRSPASSICTRLSRVSPIDGWIKLASVSTIAGSATERRLPVLRRAPSGAYDSAMTTVSTVTLPGGLTLSYAEQGDQSGPALVLLPGPTDSWRSYEPVPELLVYSGIGHTPRWEDGSRFASDVAAFIER